MNQKNGKNSLGMDKCFEELDNPIELFKKWFAKAQEKKLMTQCPSSSYKQKSTKRKDGFVKRNK